MVSIRIRHHTNRIVVDFPNFRFLSLSFSFYDTLFSTLHTKKMLQVPCIISQHPGRPLNLKEFLKGIPDTWKI